MRKAIPIILFVIIVAVVLWFAPVVANSNTVTVEAQSTLTETSIPTQTLTSTPTITPVPTATLSPTPAPTPTVPNLLGDLVFEIGFDESVSYESISLKPITEFMIVTGGHMMKGIITQQINEGDYGIPQISSVVGPPCLPGKSSWLTGYDWLSTESFYYHPAVDGKCTADVETETPKYYEFTVAAPSDCIVTAIITEEDVANSYTSSGITVLCRADDVAGNKYYFGFGHVDSEGIMVNAGDILNKGDALGTISTRRVENGVTVGTTGNTSGPHFHGFVITEYPDGTKEYLDPHDFNFVP